MGVRDGGRYLGEWGMREGEEGTRNEVCMGVVIG